MNLDQYKVGEYFHYTKTLFTGKTVYGVGLKVSPQHMIRIGLYFVAEHGAKMEAIERNAQNASN